MGLRPSLLSIPDFCRGDRPLAGLGILSEVVLHAGLDTAASGLNARTTALGVRFTGLDHRDIAQERLLARVGKAGKVLRDARPEPTAAGLNSGAMLLQIRAAGLAHRSLLGHRFGCSQ
jgi:hypothetical protein